MKPETALLDTSAVLRIDELEACDLPDQIVISAITMAELSVGPLVTDDEHERAARLAQIQDAEADFGEPIPFTRTTARTFAHVAADLRRHGGKARARSYDALIAATAIAAGLPLYTFNPRDFDGIQDLDVVPLPPERGEDD
jgi:predicted nucleic acid-binding protein